LVGGRACEFGGRGGKNLIFLYVLKTGRQRADMLWWGQMPLMGEQCPCPSGYGPGTPLVRRIASS